MYRFSILNFLLVSLLIGVSFAWVYQRVQVNTVIERNAEEIHFGWGTTKQAIATIRMAKITVDTSSELTLEHRKQLLCSLYEVMANRKMVGRYGSYDPSRSLKLASQIFDLLGVDEKEGFKKMIIELNGGESGPFQWYASSDDVDEEIQVFLRSAWENGAKAGDPLAGP